MVAFIVVTVFWIGGAGMSCWQAVHAWRDPVYARNVFFPTRFSNPSFRRGHVRGLVPFAGFMLSIGILVVCGTVASGTPSGEWALVAIAGFVLFFLCLGLHVSILCFNRPLFLVPPHMRDEMGTVTEWWRWRRDIRIALREAAERDALGQHPDPR